MSLTLLSLCCWKSHTSGLLSWRNWDEALLEEFIRAWWGGYLKRMHSPNQRITVWIRMRDVSLLQKFYQVREFRIWKKDNLLFQQTLFTRVILINNRQERLSCNRFELFNPIDSKNYTYRGKQHLNAPVGNSGRFPFRQNFRNFRFGGKWNTFCRFVPLENSQKKWKI